MNVQIEESWKARLEPEFEKDYFHTLTDFVREKNTVIIRYTLPESSYSTLSIFAHSIR